MTLKLSFTVTTWAKLMYKKNEASSEKKRTDSTPKATTNKHVLPAKRDNLDKQEKWKYLKRVKANVRILCRG